MEDSLDKFARTVATVYDKPVRKVWLWPLVLVLTILWLPELVYALNRVVQRRWRDGSSLPPLTGLYMVHSNEAGGFGLALYNAADATWYTHLAKDRRAIEVVYSWREFEGACAEPWHECPDPEFYEAPKGEADAKKELH